MAFKPDILVLDATAFIRLDFPQLQAISNVLFFTTQNVVLELKDPRSQMNLDILKYSDRLKVSSPQNKLVKEMEKRIQLIDPQTTLSSTDIEILALTHQLNGTLVSNDLSLQNIALHYNIPVKVVSGKKITFLRKWQLKCKSCGKKTEDTVENCSFCGGILKRVQKKKPNQI
ncbi:MAG: NOB1 family endonuclease [Candidatus Hodarchaeota archaeon]